jgi:hypothetical protein
MPAKTFSNILDRDIILSPLAEQSFTISESTELPHHPFRVRQDTYVPLSPP